MKCDVCNAPGAKLRFEMACDADKESFRLCSHECVASLTLGLAQKAIVAMRRRCSICLAPATHTALAILPLCACPVCTTTLVPLCSPACMAEAARRLGGEAKERVPCEHYN